MRLAVICAAGLALAGCQAANDAADTVARESAKTVVNGVVAQRFPGLNAAPITDCIIDNADRFEIFELAKASASGVTPQTTETVIAIAQRPETATCITQNGLSLFT